MAPNPPPDRRPEVLRQLRRALRQVREEGTFLPREEDLPLTEETTWTKSEAQAMSHLKAILEYVEEALEAEETLGTLDCQEACRGR